MFEVYATLQLDGQSSLRPIPSLGGYSIKPEAVRFPIRVDFNHPLTISKWIVNATVYQQMDHDRIFVELNPNSWEVDIEPTPQPILPASADMSLVYLIISIAAGGIITFVVT